MNYRHAFHAGNFADVLKHAVLTLCLEHLKRKEAAFRVIDCHAGIGRYDLWGDAANRTGEYQAGIARLLDAAAPPAGLEPYLAAVRALNPRGQPLRWYPGSPRLTQALLRPQDSLVLVELHPEDVGALGAEFAGDRRVAVRHMDAYAALKALLPPPERRGLVLIDPPFERRDEFERMLRGLAQALKRWPGGIYAAWYPIKARPPVDAFLAGMRGFERPALAVELMVRPGDVPERLNGCGLAILNPPWRLDEALAGLLPGLARLLAQEGPGGWRVDWLVAA